MRCRHCQLPVFRDDVGDLRHREHEGRACGSASPETVAETRCAPLCECGHEVHDGICGQSKPVRPCRCTRYEPMPEAK